MKRMIRILFRYVVLLVFRVQIKYSAISTKLQRHGCAIVTANHISLLDGLLICLASPVPLLFAVEVPFVRGISMTAHGLRLLVWIGFGEVVAIDQHTPHGLRYLLRALRSNRPVMIFPEGAISVDGCRSTDQAGVAWLQRQSGAMVLDVRIDGAERSRLFSKSGKHWWPAIHIKF
ncbi:1-acyl-sn-glycerol-3-phosphate acyltransferase [Glaciimonas sp. GG7]